jgi:hypothetical protein
LTGVQTAPGRSEQTPAFLAAVQKAEAQVEALKAKLVEVPEFKPGRGELRRAAQQYIGPLASGDASAVRAILRRLRIERVVAVPDGEGWRLDGGADLAGLICGGNGDSGAPPDFSPPGALGASSLKIEAPAKPALETSTDPTRSDLRLRERFSRRSFDLP